MTTGLIIGRFCPPHLGHSHLIRTAAGQVDQLVVFVNTRATEPIPGELRAGWLADLHRDVVVVEVRHDLDTDFSDPELWDRWMEVLHRHWPLPGRPDLVFSSEGYGSELARRFGAEGVAVDPDRDAVPISATQVREAPLDHLDFLAPDVRTWIEAWARERPATER